LHDPLRDHLDRLRKEHGPRFFDAPLFQARAIQGRVDRDDAEEQEADEPVPADPPEEGEASDRPASLWGYASEN